MTRQPSGRSVHALRATALLLLAAAAGTACAGTIVVPAGSLRDDGAISGAGVTISGSGVGAGTGSIADDLTLAAGGTLAPGGASAVGVLDAIGLTWQAGGRVAMRLGANDAASDQLILSGALTRQGTGSFAFDFSDGATPPSAGATYTLIRYASQSGFDAADFSYVYTGSASALVGEFRLDPDALRFVVISTPVELQSFGID
ncbi:hypothetical protein [Dokdonella fugitiva]|uniref:Uncharacterized protein n=1 Tax=Dokdonella fugitiva TaxID=328517 RepID=A0A4R2I9I6_9GAMM|nr:hypothetical protein [Dokdonella fugitiva]MBA8885198.1 hypothetical protein [Dokdonella fugitiva]TCO41084.1 hypothetical protein EV148_1033 [Dokdonella fugitiva]